MEPTPASDLSLVALQAELRETAYHALGRLGQGGMGDVFEVEHRTLRRKLVMKLLREPNRPDLEDRLRLEAQTLAQLTHPNLLQVVDFAHTSAGRPFLVTERLYGRTLKEELGPTGNLPPTEAVTFACQALAGLAAAHRAGVVHRDIKLDNLFLCQGDDLTPRHLKVIDFGIAKLVGAEEGARGVSVDPLVVPTAEGIMIGTPSFMSPEQVTSQPVDHRADIYGMGVVLYRLVAGRNPFICRDLIEYAAAHASEPPEPPSRFVALPAGLERVILRALEKKPADRYPSAREMIDALTPFSTATRAVTSEAASRPPAEVTTGPTSDVRLRAVALATQRLDTAAPLGAASRGTLRMSPPLPPSSALDDPFGAPPAFDAPDPIPRASSPFGPAAPVAENAAPPARRAMTVLELVALVVAAISAGAIVWFALILAGVL
jgi:serine/threonine-protein kinase